MRELHREIKQDQKDERLAFWRFVSVVGAVAFAGGVPRKFSFGRLPCALIEALRTWWGS